MSFLNWMKSLCHVSTFNQRFHSIKSQLHDFVRIALPEGFVEQFQRKWTLVTDCSQVGNHARQVGDSLEKPERYVLADHGRRLQQALLLERQPIELAEYDSQTDPLSEGSTTWVQAN